MSQKKRCLFKYIKQVEIYRNTEINTSTGNSVSTSIPDNPDVFNVPSEFGGDIDNFLRDFENFGSIYLIYLDHLSNYLGIPRWNNNGPIPEDPRNYFPPNQYNQNKKDGEFDLQLLFFINIIIIIYLIC